MVAISVGTKTTNLVGPAAGPRIEPFVYQEPVDINELAKDHPKVAKFIAKEYVNFATPMVAMHERWHEKNGSGGTRGAGSGHEFLYFHNKMEQGFMDRLASDPRPIAKLAYKLLHGQFPMWDTTKDLPPMFRTFGEKANINYKLPTYATVEGGTEVFKLQVGNETLEIRKLGDCRNPDEVGRMAGESGIHAVAHVALGGKKMPNFQSVMSPAFLLWHGGTVDVQIRQKWLTTPNGQLWLAANPTGWDEKALMAPPPPPRQEMISGGMNMNVRDVWESEAARQNVFR